MRHQRRTLYDVALWWYHPSTTHDRESKRHAKRQRRQQYQQLSSTNHHHHHHHLLRPTAHTTTRWNQMIRGRPHKVLSLGILLTLFVVYAYVSATQTFDSIDQSVWEGVFTWWKRDSTMSSTTTTMLQQRLGLPPNVHLVSTTPIVPQVSQNHPTIIENPFRRRTVLSLTVTPKEMHNLQTLLIDHLLTYQPYLDMLDVIHISIPLYSQRFGTVTNNSTNNDSTKQRVVRQSVTQSRVQATTSQTVLDGDYPSQHELQQFLQDAVDTSYQVVAKARQGSNSRNGILYTVGARLLQTLFGYNRVSIPTVLLHRLNQDLGPLTRYVGPLLYEQDPETAIVIFDVDSQHMDYQLRGQVPPIRSLRASQRKDTPRVVHGVPMTMTKTSNNEDRHDIVELVSISKKIDTDSIWCTQGEDFVITNGDQGQEVVRSVWDSYPSVPVPALNSRYLWWQRPTKDISYSWNQVDFCRGTGGVVFRPKHFFRQLPQQQDIVSSDTRYTRPTSLQSSSTASSSEGLDDLAGRDSSEEQPINKDSSGFWYNQTAYHESCLWDDDRWVGFQMERMGVPLKVLHRQWEVPVTDSMRKEATGGESMSNSVAVHRRLGALSGLTALNERLQSDQACTLAWMHQHPKQFPTAQRYQGESYYIPYS